ncbi:hypothetical protein PROFUN_15237 [Planoprotostelium fungivorum]|uniref:Uncharacterized protein n=1 Tax=Planoprotostelium fungivorum TaxID=1890364 RepID=A0A2P6MXI7_9EUKA|nr:hypothetical protein PROFUN_15231 [Planoprotostelium fungivorum]PRP76414.1 hypothetical protein PROFUN_15237 [Planoprotostelium fungivorum]
MGEVIITCGRSGLNTEKNKECLQVQDLRTGTLLASYKNNSSDVTCIALLGEDYIAIPQSDSSTLHFWSWRKSQVHLRSTLPERVGSIIGTKDGRYCMAGGLSGTIYVYQVATGHLLRTFEAHYKKISCLSFTEDDSMLLSGGDDGVINVWDTARLIDGSVVDVKPYVTWSDHSLPVTSIRCGHAGVRGTIVSTSLDRTCKIWDLPTKSLVHSIVFPAGLLSCHLDHSEHSLYLGASDAKIYTIHLNSAYSLSERNVKELPQNTFEGHTQAVVALGASIDGSLLASASSDGSVRLWDTSSRQCVRNFSNHGGPITALIVSMKHPDMLSSTERETTQPLESFKKFKPEEYNLPVRLQRGPPYKEILSVWEDDTSLVRTDEQKLVKKAKFLKTYLSESTQKQLDEARDTIGKLQEELDKLKQNAIGYSNHRRPLGASFKDTTHSSIEGIRLFV